MRTLSEIKLTNNISPLNMKQLQLFASYGLVAAPVLSVGVEIQQDTHSPTSQPTLELSFTKPMIDQNMVGKPANDGEFSISPAVPYETKWTSPTTLRVILKEALAFHGKYDIRVSTSYGTVESVLREDFYQHIYARPIFENSHRERYHPVYFRVVNSWVNQRDILKNPAFQEAVKKAYYEISYPHDLKREKQRVPALARPVTVAEILSLSDVGKVMRGEMNLSDQEWIDFQALPSDTIIPHIWVAAAYVPEGKDAEKATINLIIPELGSYDKAAQAYNDLRVHEMKAEESGYRLSLSPQSDGSFLAEVLFSAPVEAKDNWKDMLTSISWKQLYEDEATYPFKYMGDGRYFSQIMTEEERAQLEEMKKEELWRSDPEERSDMELVLDTERTMASFYELLLSNGEKKRCIGKLVFRVKGGIRDATLVLDADLTNLMGTKLKPFSGYNITDDARQAEFYPILPTLNMDLQLSMLPSTGKREFRIEHDRYKDARLRVIRYKNSGADAVRALAGYINYYGPSNYQDLIRDDDAPIREGASAMEHHYNQGKKQLFPSDIMPHEESRTIELKPVTDAAVYSLSDKDLYPDKEAGLYLIEILAEELDSNKAYHDTYDKLGISVVQGLVQVSDIGLLWRSDVEQSSLFVYAYQLSSGKKLKKPRVSFYDATAGLLHEQELSPEGSVLDLEEILKEKKDQISYIQVSDGTDCCTIPFKTRQNDVLRHTNSMYIPSYPQLQHEVFSDRPIYRPGETAHVKGYLRQLLDNKLSIPTKDFVEAVEVSLKKGGVTIKTFEVAVEDDGSFSYDIDIPEGDESLGNYGLDMRVVNQTDSQFQSPDMIALDWKELSTTDQLSQYQAKYEAEYAIEQNREFFYSLSVEHYKRNEFEIKGEYKLSDNEDEVQLEIQAQQYSGAPLANAELDLTVSVTGGNFYPAGLRDYRFGDYKNKDHNFFSAYFYGTDDITPLYTEFLKREYKLDASGKADLSLPIPQLEVPLRQYVQVSATVTNGNQQTLQDSSQKMIMHPADYYIGIKQPTTFSARSEQPLKLEFQAVDTEGKVCTVPSALTLTITHHVQNPYSEGSFMDIISPSAAGEETTQTHSILLDASGKGSFEMPREEAGRYTIKISGVDNEGRAFSSVVTHHVWGDKLISEDSNHFENISIQTDKDIYLAGEKVKMLLYTPIEGDVLITYEREGVLRHEMKKITADNPVVELDLQENDAPSVHVVATMIKGADLSHTGRPVIYEGSQTIHIDPVEKKLAVKLELPQGKTLPRDVCKLKGQVLDAQGQPVPEANVLLYVEDEGALQAGDFHMPALLRNFHRERPHSVRYFSSYAWLEPSLLEMRRLRNTALFLGSEQACYALYSSGGVQGGLGSGFLGRTWSASASKIILRDDFSPCSLWLARIKTDAEGRFDAEVKNPDTLTRYRVIAVASQGADRFGTGHGFYEVSKSIMLEGSAPLSACKGDKIDIPITVSMKPSDIPQEWLSDGTVRWKLQLKGNDAVQIDQPEQTLSLKGDEPVTTTFSVTMKEQGEARFEWVITAAEEGATVSASYQDALAETFTIRPATPNLRECHMTVLPAASQSSVMKWVRSDFDPQQTRIDLTLSPSPLSAYVQSTSIFSRFSAGSTEQLCTRSLPLLYAELFHQATGTPLIAEEKRNAMLSALISQIYQRSMRNPSGMNNRENFLEYTSWGINETPSVFSAYINIVLSKLSKVIADDTYMTYMLQEASRDMKRLLGEKIESQPRKVEDVDKNVLYLYLLSSTAQLNAEELRRIIPRHADEWTSVQERWIIALSAQLVDASLAEKYIEEAMLAESKFSDDEIYYLPDTETVKLLLRIHQDPSSQQTAELVNNYVNKRSTSLYLSTYEQGWMSILLADYLEKAQLQQPVAEVNGQTVKPVNPLVFTDTAISEVPTLRVGDASDPVYASYTIEGFLKEEQPAELVDKGFHVQRRYEKYQADGTWTATSEFAIGDIVRVTVTAKPRESSQYVIIEDYLPAGMEAMNPAVSGQYLSLPAGKNASQYYSFSSWITKQDFLKDRVRFAITQWKGTELLSASYLARVTKSGEMKAPAAKAEEMYRPQVYGLALPLEIKVTD